jgi:flagellar motor switch protein FliM
MKDPSVPSKLLGATAQSVESARLLASVDTLGVDLASGVRRAIPFLLRKAITVKAQPARIGSFESLVSSKGHPSFVQCYPAGSDAKHVALVVGPPGAAFLLEGSLGGSPDDDPPTPVEIMTAPQRALLSRMAETVMRALSEAFRTMGITFSNESKGAIQAKTECVEIELTVGPSDGTSLSLVLPRELFHAARHVDAPNEAETLRRNGLVLAEVEVELVVELGRVRRSIDVLRKLQVGEVLRLDVPVRAPVVIRVQDQDLFRGKPMVTGTQLSVGILERLPARADIKVRVLEPKPQASA